jgi:hypothetical protein
MYGSMRPQAYGFRIFQSLNPAHPVVRAAVRRPVALADKKNVNLSILRKFALA